MEPAFYHPCREILQNLTNSESAFYFFRPVDPEDDSAPDYYDKIMNPMCFRTIQQKLDNKTYKVPEEFVADVRLIWQNAKTYNSRSHPIFKAASELALKFETLLTSLPRTISDSAKKSDLQRYVELRFGKYASMKETHQ